MKKIDLSEVTFQHIRTLISAKINRYTAYTFPKLSFESLHRQGVEQAIYSAAIYRSQIIGLAVCIRLSNQSIRMISFFIPESYRKQGIGSRLMADVIKTCQSSQNQQLVLHYKTFWKSTEHWEALLKKTAWRISSTNNLYARLDNGQDLKQVPKLQNIEIPRDCQLSHLDSQSLQHLVGWLKLVNQIDIPSDVHPAKNPGRLNESCSLILKVKNEIAGWIIGQQIDRDKLQISSLFVFPKFRIQHNHLGLLLIAEAVKRNTHVGTTFFGMRKDNKFMQSFLDMIAGIYTLFEKKKGIIDIQ